VYFGMKSGFLPKDKSAPDDIIAGSDRSATFAPRRRRPARGPARGRARAGRRRAGNTERPGHPYEISLRGRFRAAGAGHNRVTFLTTGGHIEMVADAGPPIFLMALGLVLWLAVTATVAGISIQTIGMILFVAGAIWLVVEMIQARSVGTRGAVVEEPAYRDRRI